MAADKNVNRVRRVRIFLASSKELEAVRREFEIAINRRNKAWFERGVFLHLELWEDFLDAMSADGLQAQYNRAIQGCELFVILAWTKVGPYTAQEFEAAFERFSATRRPFIFTYFHSVPAARRVSAADRASLADFQQRLQRLKHYRTDFANVDALLRDFEHQLDKLAAEGFIRFVREEDQAPPAAAVNRVEAGAGTVVAQGSGAVAAGPGAIVIGGSVTTGGDFVTGNKIAGAARRRR